MKLATSLFTTLALTGTIAHPNANAESSELKPEGVAVLQRFAQYELLTGMEIDGRLAVCMDDALGNRWLLERAGSADIPPATIEKLRRTIEGCTALNNGTAKRLTSQLRDMTEGQLALAQRLERPASQVRGCINNSKTSEDFRVCLTQATGPSSSEPQWHKWRVIFERKSQN